MPKKYIIYDLEYTAWEGSKARGWRGAGEYREIIQIGAIQVVERKEVKSFELFVQPERNPILSEYIINLTGITQQQIDMDGISFPNALVRFFMWSHGLPLYAYGDDGDALRLNAALHNVPLLFEESNLCNIQPLFQKVGIDTEKYSSGRLPAAFGLVPPPFEHNAVNDARAILMTLNALKSD